MLAQKVVAITHKTVTVQIKRSVWSVVVESLLFQQCICFHCLASVKAILPVCWDFNRLVFKCIRTIVVQARLVILIETERVNAWRLVHRRVKVLAVILHRFLNYETI